jgi:hypothetical protein
MAKNNLTPEQDIAVREFFAKVAIVTDILPGNPADMVTVRNVCMSLLNYTITPDGRFIAKDSKRSFKYGTKVEEVGGPCEWEADYRKAQRESTDEVIASVNPVKASTGKSSAYSKIRQALFSKDL